MTEETVVTDLVNLAPFGSVASWHQGAGHVLETQAQAFDGALHSAGNPPHIGVEWDEPRNVHSVEVIFDGAAPEPSSLRLEYWRNNWPNRDPESYPASYRAWIGQDDAYHGEWTPARAEVVRDDSRVIFTVDPLDVVELSEVNELERSDSYLAPYRRTLRVRVVGISVGMVVADLRVFSCARQKQIAVEVSLLDRQHPWSPEIRAYNGSVSNVAPRAERDGGAGLLVTVDGTDAPSSSPDATLLTFRDSNSPEGSAPLEFTVRLADLEEGPLWIRDLGVYVADVDHYMGSDEWISLCGEAPRQPIYERVAKHPEQSYERAVAEIPPLDVAGHPPMGRYIVLGPEAGTLKFGLRYNGAVYVDKRRLKLNNRLAARLRWPGNELHLRLGTGDPPDFRERNGASRQEIEAGYLPVLHTRWHDRDIAFHQEAFATLRGGYHVDWRDVRGDEEPVLVMTLTARNSTTSPRRACIWLHDQPDEALSVDEAGNIVASGYLSKAEYSPAMVKLMPYDAPVLRATVRGWESGELHAVGLASEGTAFANAVLFTQNLAPGESTTLDIRIPFNSLADPTEWCEIAAIDRHQAFAETTSTWASVSRRSIELPEEERVVEEFIRAVPSHILITATKDPITGRTVAPAASFYYGSCGNEGAWQTVALDILGYHDRSREYLMSLIATQGQVLPDGRFISSEGALQATDFDEGRTKPSMFSYNLDHGTILEGILFHYRMTGDQDWLQNIATNLVAACDFVTRERGGTKKEDARTRGLLPPGHLEDNPEWQYWFAVNAHAHGGMRAAASALAEIEHPEAERLRRDADAYRRDILACVREARVAAPVVRLLSGAAIPHIPARARIRGREWGWIREVGYGPLHLLDGNVIGPLDPEVRWILQDLEDNLFINREYGYSIDADEGWFSQGGVTPQPNLLSSVPAYLLRDQPEHAVRAFYNNLVLSLYRDVHCMAEWVSEPGQGGGPFYKPSDEARVVTWLRYLLLFEQDGALWLGKGVPRAWHEEGRMYGVRDLPTFFGRVGYEVTSLPDTAGEILALVKTNFRCAPTAVKLRLRHPQGKHMVGALVNGYAAKFADGETIVLPSARTGEQQFNVVARYG